MSRVQLQKIKPGDFFKIIKIKTALSSGGLAKLLKVHQRSFSDWNRGKTLMPFSVFKKLQNLTSFRPKFSLLPDYWHVKEAGRKGASIRIKQYGNPGTPEGRAKGGKKSYQQFLRHPMLAKKVGFIIEKNIKIPLNSRSFAELIGIILGDGTVSRYQVTISLNKFTDKQYGIYIVSLIKENLRVVPSVYERDSVLYIRISSIQFVRLLLRQGLVIGNKVRQQVDIPQWIKKSQSYSKACMRGLFDTDGCFYIDHHRYRNKMYSHAAINFTNRSLPLLHFFRDRLRAFLFRPTHNTKFSIFLRRENDISKFFATIGSSNPKHLEKCKSYFIHKYGEVPKWS